MEPAVVGALIDSASNVTKTIDVMIDEMTKKEYQLLVLSDDEFERD